MWSQLKPLHIIHSFHVAVRLGYFETQQTLRPVWQHSSHCTVSRLHHRHAHITQVKKGKPKWGPAAWAQPGCHTLLMSFVPNYLWIKFFLIRLFLRLELITLHVRSIMWAVSMPSICHSHHTTNTLWFTPVMSVLMWNSQDVHNHGTTDRKKRVRPCRQHI